jgi:RIO-like serine/threonine protein kinase
MFRCRHTIIRERINALPVEGVTAPKHVGAVLMSILMKILKFFKDNSLVHQLLNKKTLIISRCTVCEN